MEKIVLYPSPGIGHIISMVELGKLLLSHSSSISSITILITNFPLITGSYSSYISSVSSSFPSITFISLPPVPLLLGDASNYQDFEHIAFEILRNNNPNILKTLQSISPVSAFIIDFFCYPALEISQSLKIPTYFFYTSGASALAFFLNFPVFDKQSSDSFRNLNTCYQIPGLFSVPASHMIEPMLDRGVSYYEFIKMTQTLPKFDGIIVNTFEALEVRAVEGLKKGICLPGTLIPPIYCIGPLIANRGESGNSKDGERHECLRWLDSQPSRSVVYLGFGSRGMFSKNQLSEIASGLEKSAVRFLWVVRAPPTPDPDLDQILPEGFLERTKDRGHVVKSWVPQIAVLGHDSVGAFVSHCGWNSTLEAVDAGVPMVAWPLYAEQRFNKILLVEEIGIALPMNESEDRFVSSSEIEIRLKQIMTSKEGDVVKKRMLDLKDKARNTLKEGSANVALSLLVKSWKY
ncbi:UDP-glycosyltransferase 88B1 [Bienertia sinuspersici]